MSAREGLHRPPFSVSFRLTDTFHLLALSSALKDFLANLPNDTISYLKDGSRVLKHVIPFLTDHSHICNHSVAETGDKCCWLPNSTCMKCWYIHINTQLGLRTAWVDQKHKHSAVQWKLLGYWSFKKNINRSLSKCFVFIACWVRLTHCPLYDIIHLHDCCRQQERCKDEQIKIVSDSDTARPSNDPRHVALSCFCSWRVECETSCIF